MKYLIFPARGKPIAPRLARGEPCIKPPDTGPPDMEHSRGDPKRLHKTGDGNMEGAALLEAAGSPRGDP